MDFGKAFDKIDDKILIRELAEIGVCGGLLEWLKSYIVDRSQYVVVNGFVLTIFFNTSAVPAPIWGHYFLSYIGTTSVSVCVI